MEADTELQQICLGPWETNLNGLLVTCNHGLTVSLKDLHTQFIAVLKTRHIIHHKQWLQRMEDA